MFVVAAHIPHKIKRDKVIETINSYQWGTIKTVGCSYFQDGMNLWLVYFEAETPEGNRIHTLLKSKGIMNYQKIHDWQFSHFNL